MSSYLFPEVLRRDFEVGLALDPCPAVRCWTGRWSDVNFTSVNQFISQLLDDALQG